MKRHLDLFSGIGGFALAASWAGYTPVQFVERDPYCQRVLRKHWPEVPIHDDIRTFDATGLRGTVDLLSGGFPCQPYSNAGKRTGAADDRALWPAMRRVIAECRPTWVLVENVPGFISLGLDDLLVDLEAIGYDAGALVVSAAGVGAPHRRERLWVVAHTDRRSEPGGAVDERPLSGRLVPDAGRTERGAWSANGDFDHRPHARRQEAPSGIGERGAAADDTDGRRHQPPDWQLPAGWNGPLDPGWWEVEPGVGRVADGIPKRVDRLRGLGNAIVPRVAYEITRHLEGAAT